MSLLIKLQALLFTLLASTSCLLNAAQIVFEQKEVPGKDWPRKLLSCEVEFGKGETHGCADWNTKSSNSESINGEAMPSIPWYKKIETAWNLDCQRNLSLLDKWFRALNLPKA